MQTRKVNKNNGMEANMNLQNTPTLSFAQLETRCYCCEKKEHKSLQCKHCNTNPKGEWAIAKPKAQFAQNEKL